MILHKSWKFSLCFVLFFNKISLEIMSHDHLVRKQALLDYKKWILHSYYSQLISQSVRQLVNQSISQPVTHSVSHLVNQSVC